MNEPITRRSALALAAVCLSSLMFGLEISSIPAILPTLEQVLGADFKQLQWIMNAYTIAVTAVLMAAGTLADRYGRKRVFVAGIIAFGIASLICGLTDNTSVLIVARFIQGMAGGVMLICQIAVLSHQFQSGRQRGIAFSWWGIIFGIGLGFGPIVGGATVALLSWEWVFLVHVVLSGVTVVLALAGVQESRDPNAESLDIAGIMTLSVAVFCIAYFITQGPELGFASPTALSILGIAIVSLASFVIAEKVSARPMFDFSVFRIRSFSGALFGSMGMNISFWPFMIYLPIWFQAGLGYDGVTASIALLAYTLPPLVVPPFAERLMLRLRPGIVIPAGLFTIGLGFFMMKLGSSVANASWLTMLPGCVVAGIGLGFTNTTVTNAATGAVASERAGMASGIDTSARMISLAINIALMGLILVEGVLSSLQSSLFGQTAGADLRMLAEKISAGGMLNSDYGLSETVIHTALREGFGWVMLYGAIGVWLSAAASLLVFGLRPRTEETLECSTAKSS
ncbi:MFS transporter [Ensifer adhaerens]|uniref:MFS transporter n=1 Tax=Ensifer adhaerens TaxID=106592 RepID=A0A0L8C3G4_ENSAD|nr:MFS transporter [Ensifer adhaerens]KOF21436.1 MFS transporter [Ensifer adhaerens]